MASTEKLNTHQKARDLHLYFVSKHTQQRTFVITGTDWRHQSIWFISSLALSLLDVLPAAAHRSGVPGSTSDVVRRRGGNRESRHVWPFRSCFCSDPACRLSAKNSDTSSPPSDQPSAPAQGRLSTIGNHQADELKQELDADVMALSKIPADPLIQPDPVAPILRPVNNLVDHSIQSLRLKFGATYTFLNQYATITPDSARHNQTSGRLDFTGAWAVYDHESTAGSISLLVRSGTNIGYSQQWNLSDRLGSGLYLNCLQGGGPQEPITLNVLYWRQDFLHKRLSF